MSEINPFEIFDFNDTETNIYKLLIQLSKIKRTKKFKKIKVVDLIEFSKYSRPKIYEVIKKLEDLGLVSIDNSRPMFITPLDPKIAFKQLIDHKKTLIENAGSMLVNQIEDLPEKEPEFPLSETSPISFFIGLKNYYKHVKYLLDRAKSNIILICGFLVKNEEKLLREYISKKLNENVEIKIIYGGAFSDVRKKENERFRSRFKQDIIDPNKSVIGKNLTRFTENGLVLAPPLRITLIDDSELILTLKRYESKDIRIGITKVSGFKSEDQDLVRFVGDTYVLLNFFVQIMVKLGVTLDKLGKDQDSRQL